MRRPRADLHDGSDCGEARIRAKMLAGPRAEPRLTRRKIAKGRATFTDSNEQGVFMHVAKRRTVSAALGAALVALCTTGLNSALATEKAAAVRASAQAQSGGSTLAVANNILNRWEAIAQAAGVHSAIWRELFGTQLNQMSEQALRRLEMVSAEGSPKAAYARFTEAFAGAQMQRFASEESAKTVLKDLGSTSIDQVFIRSPRVEWSTCARAAAARDRSPPGTARLLFLQRQPVMVVADRCERHRGTGRSARRRCHGLSRDVHDGRGRDVGRGRTSAAVATVTAVGPTAAGNLLVWGGAGSPPTSSALNFSAGQTLANTTVIPAGGRSGGALDFTVRYNGPSGQADIVVDVVGYFVQSGATALQCNLPDGQRHGHVQIPRTGTNFQLSFPSCTTGYTATGYGCGYAGAIPAAAYLQESSPFWGYCNWFTIRDHAQPVELFRRNAVLPRSGTVTG